jgi:hypothetical protein
VKVMGKSQTSIQVIQNVLKKIAAHAEKMWFPYFANFDGASTDSDVKPQNVGFSRLNDLTFYYIRKYLVFIENSSQNRSDFLFVHLVGTGISQSNNGSFGRVWLAEAVGSGFEMLRLFSVTLPLNSE